MFCPNCGNKFEGNFCTNCGSKVNMNDAPESNKENNRNSGIKCPKCKSQNVKIQAVTTTKTKHRGCLGWCLWILLAICTLGLIIIIPLITNSKTKSKTHSEAVCQNCGNRWKV